MVDIRHDFPGVTAAPSGNSDSASNLLRGAVLKAAEIESYVLFGWNEFWHRLIVSVWISSIFMISINGGLCRLLAMDYHIWDSFMLVLSYNIVHFVRFVLNIMPMGSCSLLLFMNTLDLMFFLSSNWRVFRVVFIFVVCILCSQQRVWQSFAHVNVFLVRVWTLICMWLDNQLCALSRCDWCPSYE
jgi:hypothetical protein